jgi:hypothetical protein
MYGQCLLFSIGINPLFYQASGVLVVSMQQLIVPLAMASHGKQKNRKAIG